MSVYGLPGSRSNCYRNALAGLDSYRVASCLEFTCFIHDWKQCTFCTAAAIMPLTGQRIPA
ncbi:MAG: hypothetical protein OXR07_10335 [Nitrospira sp.]|nr:hypothetical protein [Nitrospira sp.]